MSMGCTYKVVAQTLVFFTRYIWMVPLLLNCFSRSSRAKNFKKVGEEMLFRWIGPLLVSCVLLGSGLTHAASHDQIQNQLKQLDSLCLQKSWEKVSKLAQKWIESPAAHKHSTSTARVYVCLGTMFYSKKLRSLAARSFEKAVRLDSAVQLQGTASSSLSAFFTKAKTRVVKELQYYQKGLGKGIIGSQSSSASTSSPKHTSVPKGKTHIGWVIGWPTALVGAGALIGAIGAKYSALSDFSSAHWLFNEALAKGYPDTLITPTVTSLQNRSKAYDSVSTVLFIAGGAVSAAAIGFFVWAALAPQKEKTAAHTMVPSKATRYVSTPTLHPRSSASSKFVFEAH